MADLGISVSKKCHKTGCISSVSNSLGHHLLLLFGNEMQENGDLEYLFYVSRGVVHDYFNMKMTEFFFK